MRICLLLLCICTTLPLLAQRSEEWKRQHDRGTRYEGTYTRQVGNPDLELVSLSAGITPYTFRKGMMLKARFHSPASLRCTLHAEDLSGTQFYWWEDKQTQAAPGWNLSPADWPVDFLLDDLHLLVSNLGISAAVAGSERKYLPVQVFTGSVPPPIERYSAVLRLGRSSAGGSYQIYKGESRSGTPVLKGTITARSGGGLISLGMPAASFPAPGWYLAEISLKEQGTLDPFSYSFRFYVPPRP
ncbi:MAG: hypothetical protein NW241_09450 [Bacteroidia bacterium]|nr:hypothetical protein [Bacteroidia bacterium]